MADSTISEAAKAQEIERLRLEAQEEIARKLNVFFESVLEHSYKYAGAGSYYSQFHKTLARIDRYGIRTVTQNNEHAGLTFITRPKLNFESGNLRQNRVLNMLDTRDPKTIQFMIRCLLDTKFCYKNDILKIALESPLLDVRCPFLTPLTNCVESISGFPSANIETYTTDGGFFSEDLTFAAGSDRNRKSFDLQLSFVDIQGGIIAAIFQMWMEYITAVTLGEMVAYGEDVDAQRINYTVSLYRFLLDPSKRYITRWCKCTGGFPISRPSGAVFDLNTSEIFVESAKKFSVTFKFNHMGVENDPIILKEFNMLVAKYHQNIKTADVHGKTGMQIMGTDPQDNYTGIPYISMTKYGPMLQFREVTGANDDTIDRDIQTIQSEIKAIQSNLDAQVAKLSTSPSVTSSSPVIVAGDVTYLNG